MLHDLIFQTGILQPDEAAVLHEATRKAIDVIGASSLSDRQRALVARDVMRLVKSGYTRTTDGSLDAVSLAEAAVLRYRSSKPDDG